MKHKILLIADVKHSALGIAAQSRAEILGAQVVYAFDYPTPKKLLEFIIKCEVSQVLFTWRHALIDVLNSCDTKDLQFLRKSTSLGVLIPDHIGLSHEFQIEEKKLLSYVDFYMVTSKLLFELYTDLKVVPKPAGVLHDIPNVSLIREIRGETKTKSSNQVIWVGNSRWGEKQGFLDHKGFDSIIKTMMVSISELGCCSNIQVIDSARERKSNTETLRAIRKAKLLLQSSESEGTGLPILEALGLGVTPLTTDVGIAREILGEHLELIVGRDPKQFHALIHRELNSPSLTPSMAIQIFEEYIALISSEVLPKTLLGQLKNANWSRQQFKIHVPISLIWILRFLRNKKRI